MGKKKIIRLVFILIGVGLLVGGGTVLYLFNMPHRNVQAQGIDAEISSSQLVAQFLSDVDKANAQYLDEEGESKILAVNGTVANISEDYEGNSVALLKSKDDSAGVSCTFLPETKAQGQSLQIGQQITVKGVIRAGAAYDADLEMYEHVVLDKCAILD